MDLDDLDGTHRRYGSQRAYGPAKLATVVFTRELAGACRAPVCPRPPSTPA
jgi:hypothetical protein